MSFSVITKSQLEAIKEKCFDKPPDINLERRKELKKLSDERAQKWPNTLQAQRARKEKAKIERLEAEEAERVEIDRQEAELRAEQRRIQIERANNVIFNETDKVKAFHSKMLLSDVLRENENQIALKKQVDILKRAQEQAFVEQQRQALELAETLELQKMSETRKRALKQKDEQLDQLDHLRNRILAERARDREEGQNLKLKAQEEVEESKRIESATRARARKLQEDSLRANDTLKLFRQKEVEKSLEEDLAIESYAKKRAELMAERERREAEKRVQKELQRRKLQEAIENTLVSSRVKEEERFALDVEQAERRIALEEAERRKRQQEVLADIDASRRAQLKQKAEDRKKMKEDDSEFSKVWKERCKALEEEEKQEQSEKFGRSKNIQSYQLRQAAIRARRKAEQRIADLEAATQVQLSLKEQEEVFQQYAALCIEECRSKGRSTLPMELHLSKKESLAR
mmetsp:Transcript_34872/g.62719  ORF Transcript_34872/g.62719 Transcript_34872/m.62719 type:complete len:460 (-) Transcript_34872:166-1545(-)|eukprot:CAMPEP_0175058466 /NCGR_PEP_ID=MMETSP0052_2-20121109/11863_1 /TAXON_ID=51329 ORGANISM="Polytomella parva, Strain SAG 63-3" /NCGR_SAMPLE_ID=MMETSP0052_2 /ASSEMBLY_ACC=CAM_ASM_000194 /LENGTH=459 /DNA_ID=CAMNT_0016323849 /DNA_START=162 /DNA_END=1541 /DNA_ORIENTATION=+